MITFPNAKINIGLDILRRRPDGYHDISTVMVPVAWCDVLEIVPGKGDCDTLAVSGRAVDCPPEKNLVMKAVKALRKIAEFPAADLFLHKVIPDGAGLGGGPADAAFALVMLNEIFALGLDKPQLAEVASSLGADCPFFIYNTPMLCTGIGTELSPIDLQFSRDMRIVVVKPAVSVSTATAYSAVTPEVPATPLEKKLATLPVESWQHEVKNDFEKSVFPVAGEIERVKQRLLAEGAVYASMSGSGSAVYGLFDNDRMAENAARSFEGCDVFAGDFR